MKTTPSGDLVLVEAGDLIRRPKMARTLQRIADDPEAFYRGQLALDIVEDIKEYGGNITLDDLADYTALIKDPLNVTLDNEDYTVFSPRPPSSGLVYNFILNILKGYNFRTETRSNTADWVLTYHRIVEAFKFAYAKRSALGDEDHVDLQGLIANLTSDSYCEAIRNAINDTHTQDMMYYQPDFGIQGNHGTAHLSVLAPDGGAVGITSTINLFFGSNVRGNRTGIFFNDIMDDFSTPGVINSFGVPASPSNFIQPGKRPMSSMGPSIIVNKDGHVIHVTGASGGTRITTAQTLVTINNLWFNMTLVDSVDQPRLHHQLAPENLIYERNFNPEVLDGLKKKGHKMRPRRASAVVGPVASSCHACHGVSCRTCISAVTDARKPSKPDGF